MNNRGLLYVLAEREAGHIPAVMDCLRATSPFEPIRVATAAELMMRWRRPTLRARVVLFDGGVRGDPYWDPKRFLAELKCQFPELPPVIVLTTRHRPEQDGRSYADEVVAEGARSCLVAPFPFQHLIDACRDVASRS